MVYGVDGMFYCIEYGVCMSVVDVVIWIEEIGCWFVGFDGCFMCVIGLVCINNECYVCDEEFVK